MVKYKKKNSVRLFHAFYFSSKLQYFAEDQTTLKNIRCMNGIEFREKNSRNDKKREVEKYNMTLGVKKL